MDYMVIGADGKEYGPVDVPTLKTWIGENRVGPQTQLKDFTSGRMLYASGVPDLFPSTAAPNQNWAQPPSPYPRGMQYANPRYDDGKNDVMWAFVRSGLAILFFFVFKGVGLLIGIYGLIYAIRGNSKGHKHGPLAIGISALALAIIAVGWFFRMNGAGI